MWGKVIMKCPKCNGEMLLLLISYTCEACDTGETPVTTATEAKDSIKPPLCTTRWAYQEIGGVEFYYDPEYAKKRHLSNCIFQIKVGTRDRYIFDKANIQKLLNLLEYPLKNYPPKEFDDTVAGVDFKYDKATNLLSIGHNQGVFDNWDIKKIYEFFKPLLNRAP